MAYHLVEVLSLGGLDTKKLEEIEAARPVPGERDLKSSRLRFLTGLLEDGKFNRCDWGTCHCKEDGLTYRCNGQHSSNRLRAVLNGEIEAEFPEGVPVTLTKYECDTKLELANVFDQFDQHHSSRSADDKLGIYIAQHSDLVGIDKKLIGKILCGVDFLRKQKVELALTEIGPVEVPEAHERGRLLAVDSVRDFIDMMHDYEDAPFKLWEGKQGICARFYMAFIEHGKEMARDLIEVTVNIADESSRSYTEQIARADSRKGKEAGWFYRATDKHLRQLVKLHAQIGAAGIKELIREVLEEKEEQGEELVEV